LYVVFGLDVRPSQGRLRERVLEACLPVLAFEPGG
jgi:hypothetical protein